MAQIKITPKLPDSIRVIPTMTEDHQAIWTAILVSGYVYEPAGQSWRKANSAIKAVDLVRTKLQNNLQTLPLSAAMIAGKVVEIEAVWSTIEAMAAGNVQQQLGAVDAWRKAWGDLCLLRFSKIDREMWSGLMHTYDSEGKRIVVCPTGVAAEYKIVGSDPDDVYKWMASMRVDGQSLLAHIERKICDVILSNTTGLTLTETTPIGLLNGDTMSSACCLSIVNPSPVLDPTTGAFQGYVLKINSKVTAEDYVKTSFESFVACEDFSIPQMLDLSNDPTVPCLRYIPIVKCTGRWDTWRDWMHETFELPSAVPVFMSWVGSFLDAENTGKQACWIHGHGNDGKSKVSDALLLHLGQSARSINGKSMGNQFGLSKLEGKRLIVVADAKNPKLMQSEWVHNLTGGDSVDVERKGKDSYSAKLIGKLLVCANICPEIRTDELNQVTRLIYIKCRRRTPEELLQKKMAIRDADGRICFVGNNEFPKKLIAETEAFLSACYNVYIKNAPTRSDIPLPEDMVEQTRIQTADPKSEAISDLIDLLFEFGEKNECLANDAISAIQVVEKQFGINARNAFDMSEINTYISNRGVTKVQPRQADGSRPRMFVGMKLKDHDGF